MTRGHTLAPYRHLLWIWLALLLLLAATCGSAFVPLEWGNAVVNLAIAAIKASLVAVVYMHLRKSGALLRLSLAVALFMFAVMFALSGTDYATRLIHPAPWQARSQTS